MISFFIDLALFCIGVYCAVVIAALALVFLMNALAYAVAGVAGIGVAAFRVVRAVVMLDGIGLWIARALHAAFSAWMLVDYRTHDYNPAEYEPAAWVILVGLVLFWFIPWTRELAVSIRGRLRSRRAVGRAGDHPVQKRDGDERNRHTPSLC